MQEGKDTIAECLGCNLSHGLARDLWVIQGGIPRRGGEFGGGGNESR